jgi:hypothetical protein
VIGYASIMVNPIPPAPIVSILGNVLSSNYIFGNQWFNSSGPITGAVSQQYSPPGPGVYYCQVTEAGCTSAPSNPVTITSVINTIMPEAPSTYYLYPNPSDKIIFIYSHAQSPDFSRLEIVSLTGNVVQKTPAYKPQCGIDISGLKAGMYFLRISQLDQEVSTLKFIKN